MWWLVVFWVLFILLIIAEVIIYFATKKYSPLIYAIAAFTYVVTVTYTIDVFDLGRNTIILILLVSAGIMVLLGKQLQKRWYNLKAERIAALAIGVAILAIFIISIAFGNLRETIQPAQSIRAGEIAYSFDEKGREVPVIAHNPVTVLNRTLQNSFFLPVPVKTGEYKMCLITNSSTYDLWSEGDYSEHPEIAAHSTEVVALKVSPISISSSERPSELLVYRFDNNGAERSYAPCTSFSEEQLVYRIPVI